MLYTPIETMPNSFTRRDLLKTLTAAPAASSAAAAAAHRPYNVLFLMSDEHSPHVVGCFGNKVAGTPAIDSLAVRGTRFSAAYCQNPLCVPSRASFLTGRMASNVGVFGNVPNTLDGSVTTMADVFTEAGYTAGWMGKTHWGGSPRFETPKRSKAAEETAARRFARSRLPSDAAIADWPVNEEFDTITKDQALRFLERNRAKPFFAGVSFKKPHFPFLVQDRYYRMYQDRVEAPHVAQEMLDQLPLVSRNERKTYKFAGLTEPQIRKALAIYYGMVSYIDGLIQEILNKLDELGLRENTIILYTADHGELGGEHGLWYKNSFYEASVRIPHVWSFPKDIPQGLEIQAPVMNMDIFPTLCDLCGLPKPRGLEGRSLVPLMKRVEEGAGRYALSENYRSNSAARMIRTTRWKYCYFRDDREQLFDMQNDPGEIENLAQNREYRETATSLKSRALTGWHYEKIEEYRRKARAARAAGVSDEP